MAYIAKNSNEFEMTHDMIMEFTSDMGVIIIRMVFNGVIYFLVKLFSAETNASYID